MRNISDKSFREYQNTHFMFSNIFPLKIVWFFWDNVEKSGTARQATDDNITRLMRFACRMIKEMIQTHMYNVKQVLFFHDNNS